MTGTGDQNDEREQRPPDDSASPSAGRPADRRLVSRRWFLVWLAGGAAALVGGRRLLGDALRGGGGDDGGGSDATGAKGPPGFAVRSVDSVPDTPLAQWVLDIDGLVEHPARVAHSDWIALPRREQTVDFHCVEGWGVRRVRWSGVRVADVLALARPRAAATHAVFHADDGTYSDSLPLALATAEQTLLADGIDGIPLPPDHGGPMRLVVPSQLGYKNVKWVRRIELTDHGITGYWEQLGYPADAPVT